MAESGFSVVADYKVVRVASFRLNLDLSRSFDFELPEAVEAGRTMLVTFFLVSSHDLRMNIAIDGVTISTRKYSNGPERAIYHAVPELEAKPFKKRMTFTTSRGEAFLGDVVLWFQRRVDVFASATGGIVADYKVVRATPVRLGVNAVATRVFEFGLPEAIEAAPRDSPMILTYLLVSSHDLHMQVAIDDQIVSDRQFTNGPERCIQEVVSDVSAAPLRKKISFTAIRGEVLLTDVVMWFQRAADFEDVVVTG